MNLNFNIIIASNGDYHWNIKARNGEIIATGAEGYKKLQGLRKGFKSLVVKSFGIKDIDRAEIMSVVDKEINRVKNLKK